MSRMRIEWEALEPALRKLKKNELLDVLAEAYRALPASGVVTVFGQYIDLPLREASRSARRGAAPRRLLEAVQRFHADSLAGQYCELFNVNSRNFMDKSEGTELWINSCNQLFERCVEASVRGHHVETCTAMDLLFELLEQGKIEPIIAEKFPILEAAQANALLESGQVVGNVVLLAPELL